MAKRTLVGAVAAWALLVSCSGTATPSAVAPQQPATAVPTTAATATTTAEPSSTVAAAPTPAAACDRRALAEMETPVDITLRHRFVGASARTLGGLVDQYNNAQPKVRVTLLGAADTGAEEGSDVRVVPTGLFPSATEGQTFAVQECIDGEQFDTTDYLAPTLAYFRLAGKLDAMPLGVSIPVLIYNREMFRNAGLDPDKPPATLAEMAEAARAITTSGAASSALVLDSGEAGGAAWVFEHLRAQAGLPFTDNDNGSTARATKVVWNDDAQRATLTSLQALVKEGAAVNVGAAAKSENLSRLLAVNDQRAAMTIDSSAALDGLLAVVEAGGSPGFSEDNLGVGPSPRASGTNPPLIEGSGLHIAKDLGPAKTAAAWDLIVFLTSTESQRTWAAETGDVPVRKSARPDGLLGTVFDMANVEVTSAGTATLVVGPRQEIRASSARAVEAIYAGTDVAQALAIAEAEHNALLAG